MRRAVSEPQGTISGAADRRAAPIAAVACQRTIASLQTSAAGPQSPNDGPQSPAPGPDVSVPYPQSSLFRNDHLDEDLKGRSVRGGAATLGGQAANFVLKLGSTAILARLLTPADFGLIAMVTAVTGFVEMFKDAGLSMATVQRAEINHRQVSTLFWINVALSLLLMLVVMALAPAVAWFYSEPQLLPVTLALGALFPLGGLTIQHQAVLHRQMRFGTLASIDVASNALGIVAAIIAAAFGARYWALVAMMAAAGISNMALVWLRCGWRPGLPVRGSGVRPMLAFGGNLTGFTFVNYWARNADNLLIGWYWGAVPLGLYSRAYSLLTLPLAQINAPVAAVAAPAMSRLQRQPDRYAQYYLRALSGTTLMVFPLAVALILFADDFIEILLGPQWSGAVLTFRLLGLAALLQPIGNSTGWLYVSNGRTDRMFAWGVFASTVTLATFLVAVAFGVNCLAASYSVEMVVLAWPCVAWACHGTPVFPMRVFSAVYPQLLAALAAGVAAWSIRCAVASSSPGRYVGLCVAGAGLACVYVACIAIVPAARATILSSLRAFRRR